MEGSMLIIFAGVSRNHKLRKVDCFPCLCDIQLSSSAISGDFVGFAEVSHSARHGMPDLWCAIVS